MSSSTSWPCAALPHAPLGPRTTLRVGGSVEWLLEPARPEELVEAWVTARERGFLPRVLGGGANLLIEDGEHPGVVIATDRMARVFRAELDRDPFESEADLGPDGRGAVDESVEPRFVVWAGAGMPGLVRASRELGWTGLEGLAGVPGQIGGGIAMNAGGRWGDLWDVVESVRLLTPDGELVERARAECSPSYRNGNLGEHVLVAAILRLERGDKALVREAIRDYLAQKNATQPVTEHSCGCIFKNPDPELSEGRSAGRLIEEAGGKGLSHGGARISEKHANFVVNAGGARAEDVFALIAAARELVLERTGVRLEREVRTWPREPA